MKLLEFLERFPDEKSCRHNLNDQREKCSLDCKHCGFHHYHYCDKSNNCWACVRCGLGPPLTLETVIHGSKLSLLYWFSAIHLFTSTRKIFSAQEMQRQLGNKCCQPIWEMMRKLRSVMGMRDDRYSLSWAIELDGKFKISLEQAAKILPWVHTVISNPKSQLLDRYHGIIDEFIQNYLNEFCWKFNRRIFAEHLFDRFMVASVSYVPTFKHRVYGNIDTPSCE